MESTDEDEPIMASTLLAPTLIAGILALLAWAILIFRRNYQLGRDTFVARGWYRTAGPLVGPARVRL